jgi:hypothetical protein
MSTYHLDPQPSSATATGLMAAHLEPAHGGTRFEIEGVVREHRRHPAGDEVMPGEAQMTVSIRNGRARASVNRLFAELVRVSLITKR